MGEVFARCGKEPPPGTRALVIVGFARERLPRSSRRREKTATFCPSLRNDAKNENAWFGRRSDGDQPQANSLQIRIAREDDATALAQAEWETATANEGLLVALPGEIPVTAYRHAINRLAQTGLYVVIESGEQLLGHLMIDPGALQALRHVGQVTIVVHPGQTGKGYGRRLMQHAIDWARKSDRFEKLELRVRATNARAIALYESVGFEREGVLRNRIKLSSGYVDDVCMALFV